MRKLIPAFLFFLFALSGFSSASEIENYIQQCELLVYFPALDDSISSGKELIKRFYGKNYQQMLEETAANSITMYGVNILDPKALENAGLDIQQPAAYVHISNNTGYLLLPVKSRKTVEKFIQTKLGDGVPYQFMGNYLVFSENPELTVSITNGVLLIQNPAYRTAAERLNFNWKKHFIWMESRYLSEVSASSGVTANIKIPYGFSAFTIDFLKNKIAVENYSGMLSDEQTKFLQSMRSFSAEEKVNIIDHAWGNPAAIASLYLNVPLLYKYYSYVDSINILGIKGLVSELFQKYKINVERDLIQNADGRVKAVIHQYDTEKNNYVLYGSIGIKNPETAGRFMDSIKNAVIQNGEKLYSFDIFTYPFYHYQSSNYSVFYGVVKNEFVFASDKTVLTNLLQNVFENRNGYLDNLPEFFRTAETAQKPGYSLKLDIQGLFSSVKTGLQINRDFLMSIRDIDIHGYPDMDPKPLGWITYIDINYYE